MTTQENSYTNFVSGFVGSALFCNGLGNYGIGDMCFETKDMMKHVCQTFFNENESILTKSNEDFYDLGRMFYKSFNGVSTIYDSISLPNEDKTQLIMSATKNKPFKLTVDDGDTVFHT